VRRLPRLARCAKHHRDPTLRARARADPTVRAPDCAAPGPDRQPNPCPTAVAQHRPARTKLAAGPVTAATAPPGRPARGGPGAGGQDRPATTRHGGPVAGKLAAVAQCRTARGTPHSRSDSCPAAGTEPSPGAIAASRR
jgi:hypothetical protein